MTKITFFKKKDNYLGFEVKGHTGKDEYGKDLLCAQLSTVAQLAVVGIKEVAKEKCFCQISDGWLKITLKKKKFNFCLKFAFILSNLSSLMKKNMQNWR